MKDNNQCLIALSDQLLFAAWCIVIRSPRLVNSQLLAEIRNGVSSCLLGFVLNGVHNVYNASTKRIQSRPT